MQEEFGGAQLNIYTARLSSSIPGSTVLGYAYSPWDVTDNVVKDAVFLNDRTLPGGSATSQTYTYNKGIVAVHEVIFSRPSDKLQLSNTALVLH